MEVGGVCEDVEVGVEVCGVCGHVRCVSVEEFADVEVELGSVRWSYGGAQTCVRVCETVKKEEIRDEMHEVEG